MFFSLDRLVNKNHMSAKFSYHRFNLNREEDSLVSVFLTETSKKLQLAFGVCYFVFSHGQSNEKDKIPENRKNRN